MGDARDKGLHTPVERIQVRLLRHVRLERDDVAAGSEASEFGDLEEGPRRRREERSGEECEGCEDRGKHDHFKFALSVLASVNLRVSRGWVKILLDRGIYTTRWAMPAL